MTSRAQKVSTAVAVLLLTGCSSFFDRGNWQRLVSGPTELQEVSIKADADVNDGYPLALDIVFISDPGVLSAISGLRAAEWFAGKADFQRQHQKVLAVSSWEMVPKQQFRKISLPDESKAAVGVLLFADYTGPRTRSYRMLIQGKKKVVIRLRRNDFGLSPE